MKTMRAKLRITNVTKNSETCETVQFMAVRVASELFGWRLVHWTFHGESIARNSAFPPHLLARGLEGYSTAKDGWLTIDALSDVAYLAMIVSGRSYPIPRYSSSIADAWLVVEAMAERGWSLALEDAPGRALPDSRWDATFNDRELTSSVAAATAPRAICLAALESVGALAVAESEGSA